MTMRDVYDTGFDEENGKTIRTETCPECPGSLVTDGGEISCTACGLIVNEYWLDHGYERSDFEDDHRQIKRTGAPLTSARHDRGLSSEIGYRIDGQGNTLSGRARSRVNRMRREHSRAKFQSKADRNLAHACGELRRMTSGIGLPTSVAEEASTIYRRAHTEDLICGRSIELMAAGSLYATCRCRGYPRTPDEIATTASCSTNDVLLGYRVLNTEFGLNAQVVPVRAWVDRFASACSAPPRVRTQARELAEQAEEAGLANGKQPSGVAAACLYLAGCECEAGETQADLAAIAGLSTATIQARSSELRDLLFNQREKPALQRGRESRTLDATAERSRPDRNPRA